MTKGGDRFERALYLALVAHSGQVDKSGEAYIKHVLRVAGAFTEETLQVVALLHDTVEDAGFDLAFIQQEFGPEVREAVNFLTHLGETNYTAYIEEFKHNEIARQVKIADLRDHLRLPSPLTDVQIEKYRDAFKRLTGWEWKVGD